MIIILLLMFSLLSGIIFILNDYVSIQKDITSEFDDEIIPASKLEIAIPKTVTNLEHSVLDLDSERAENWRKQASQIDKTFDILVTEEQISANHKKTYYEGPGGLAKDQEYRQLNCQGHRRKPGTGSIQQLRRPKYQRQPGS